MDAAVELSLQDQRKQFQTSAVRDATTGFRQYSHSYKVNSNVLEDPAVGGTYYPVVGYKKPVEEDNGQNESTTIPVPPPEEVPKVAGVVPPLPDDEDDKDGTEAVAMDSAMDNVVYKLSTHEETTTPIDYNRVVYVKIDDKYEDDSVASSLPMPKDPDEDSDGIIDHVLDKELWDETDDDPRLEELVTMPEDNDGEDKTGDDKTRDDGDDTDVQVIKVTKPDNTDNTKTDNTKPKGKKAKKDAPVQSTLGWKRKPSPSSAPTSPAKKRNKTVPIRQSPRIHKNNKKLLKDRTTKRSQVDTEENDEMSVDRDLEKDESALNTEEEDDDGNDENQDQGDDDVCDDDEEESTRSDGDDDDNDDENDDDERDEEEEEDEDDAEE